MGNAEYLVVTHKIYNKKEPTAIKLDVLMIKVDNTDVLSSPKSLRGIFLLFFFILTSINILELIELFN